MQDSNVRISTEHISTIGEEPDSFFEMYGEEGLAHFYYTDNRDEETKLLKLQKQYRSGKIKGEELTEEQINALSELYDKQIAKLKETNSIM